MKLKIKKAAILLVTTGFSFVTTVSYGQGRNEIKLIALNDSTIIVYIDNNKSEIKIHNNPTCSFDWSSTKELADKFAVFYAEYKYPAKIELRKSIDITGDRKKELVLSTVKTYHDSCTIQNLIISDNDTIWNDVLSIDNDYAIYKYCSKELFEVLKPYSFPFLTLWRTDFVSEAQFDDEQIKEIQNHYLQSASTVDSLYWEKELKNYNGKVISKMHYEGGASSYIWDRKHRIMIEIYSE
jgi:hypothetical protein